MTPVQLATRIAEAMHSLRCQKDHPPAVTPRGEQGWTFAWPCGLTRALGKDPEGLRATARYWQVAAGDTL